MVFDPFLQFFPIRMGEKLGEKVDGCFHIRRCGADAFKTGLFTVQFFPVAGKFADAVAVGAQIACHINENLINGINVDVLRGNIIQVNVVDLRAVIHIQVHAASGYSNQSAGFQ